MTPAPQNDVLLHNLKYLVLIDSVGGIRIELLILVGGCSDGELSCCTVRAITELHLQSTTITFMKIQMLTEPLSWMVKVFVGMPNVTHLQRLLLHMNHRLLVS